MVTPRGDEFEVVFGNHRLEACRRLSWKEIPATIVEATDRESLVLQIVENVQRNVRINPVDEAKAYRFLMNKGMTIQEIGTAVGKSYQYVWSKTRLLEALHPKILEGLEQDKFRNVTVSHAEQLSLLKDTGRQLELTKAIEDYGTSVRELEKVIYEELFEDVSSEISSKKRNAQLPVWKKGKIYFIEETRHCMVSYSTFNTVIDSLGRKARRVGRKAGELRRRRFLEIAERTISKREWLVKCFESCGWGRIEVDGSEVRFRNSITKNTLFIMGYVEGLLGLRLKRVVMSTGVDHVFEISSSRGEIKDDENTSITKLEEGAASAAM